jgi:hypothetical protein
MEEFPMTQSQAGRLATAILFTAVIPAAAQGFADDARVGTRVILRSRECHRIAGCAALVPTGPRYHQPTITQFD